MRETQPPLVISLVYREQRECRHHMDMHDDRQDGETLTPWVARLQVPQVVNSHLQDLSFLKLC